MKTLQKLTLLMFILIQLIGNSQTKDINIFAEKYNSILKKQNKGIAILVRKNNKTEHISLGNFNLTEHSVFNIGSATKTFTAILILQEMEKGNIKLTDSIGKYLSPIKNVDPSLTIKSLLTHESGLDEVIGENIEKIFYAKKDSLYNINLLNEVEKSNPKLKGKFNYCNTNYFLLGKIIEKVTDQNYFDLLRERIFIPINMKETYPYVHKNINNLATPFYKNKDVTSYIDYRYFANIAYAAGSIASTLSDMEIFYTSLFETEKLLQKETLKLMLESGNKTYGYGIFKFNFNNKNYYGHGGNNIGYAFRNEYNPTTKNLYLIFSNSKSITSKKAITSDLLAYVNDNSISNFKKIDLKKFKKYTGTYLLKEANLTLNIIQENNKMYLVVDAQKVKSELIQKNDKALYDTTVGVILTQIEGDSNSLEFNQNGFKTVISKINSKN
ncbi:CubicO group peptidase (beta-lactamase class C family) [Cellulophaga sp. RHA19]|uniref:serine hydrolase domain-containing protein n=1 Tax=Cellulophaga sp. RHA19 TaxID=1798237 RepID=UPI000CC9E7F2|nr:serine hydrolase [Cellulophaga sp. RHA19]PKB44420.1 CubicO group peptidase (beta-lactamase class C family) [Cellulophaga sp. RHA19]